MNAGLSPWAWAAAAAAVLAVLLAAGAAVVIHHRRLRTHLAALAQQILSISEGRFEQRVQPPVAALQPLAQSINVMAAQMAITLAERDQQFGALRSEVDRDPLTGLESRVPFMERLVQRLSDPAAPAGTLAILRLTDLAGLNRRFGRERGDELLRSVAALLRLRGLRLQRPGGSADESADGVVVSRLNGADFGLLLPATDSAQVTQWLDDVARSLRSLPVMAGGELVRVGWIGASRWQPGEALGELLARADGMLQTCESGDHDWRLAEPGDGGGMNIARWRVALDDALQTGRIGVQLEPVLRCDGALDHSHAVAFIALPGQLRLQGDDLLAPAARCLRRVDVDLRVTELALQALQADDLALAIDIGWESALRPNFLLRLDGVLQRAGDATRRLRVDIDMRPGRHEGLAPLMPLLALLRRHGVPAGLDCVAGPFTDMTELARLGVATLALDAALTTGLSQPGAAGRRRLTELMVEVARSQSVGVVARGVANPADLRCLWALGLSAAAGPAVQREPALAA